MKPDLLLMTAMLPEIEKSLASLCEVHCPAGKDAFPDSLVPRIRAVATGGEQALQRNCLDVFVDGLHVPEALLNMEQVVLQLHWASAPRRRAPT